MGVSPDFLQELKAHRLIVIFRGDYQDRWLDYASALLASEVSYLEITLNSPGALAGIRELKRALGDRVTVGAGTVLNAGQAFEAIDAGAQFVVSPDTTREVVDACKSRKTPVVPGAYSPTEVARAHRLGADAVKLFPAQTPEYLRLIHGPLGHIPLIVTGGVTAENARQFIRYGACAVGVGTYLTDTRLELSDVTARAASLRRVLLDA